MTGRSSAAALTAVVLRGMRARASLTLGSMLLICVAVAAAVLGPTYQVSSSQSFLVARLQEADQTGAGASFQWTPKGDLSANPQGALAKAPTLAADRLDASFGPPTLTLRTYVVSIRDVVKTTIVGEAHLLSTAGVCEAVEIDGDCPTGPHQVIVLKADIDRLGLAVGDHLDFPGVVDGLTLVGSYTVPDEAETALYDLSRYASIPPPPAGATSGPPTPYQAAPLIVDPVAFDSLEPGTWAIDVDRRLDVRPDISSGDVEAARSAVGTLPRTLRGSAPGRFEVSEDNQLHFIIDEIDANRDTARATVLPAVVSLVLVALALLARLLGAAADQRRHELALASLRGMNPRQMWTFGLAQPMAMIALATPLGVALGYGAAVGLSHRWLVEGVPVPLVAASAWTAVVVVAAAVVTAVLTVNRALRETLASQLAGVRRPTRSTRLVLVLRMTIVVAAAALVVTSLTAKGRSDPDAADQILPLVLAAAFGLLTTSATVAVAGWWTRRTRQRRGISTFVASRAVSRRREASLVVLPLTAALAISVFAAGVYAASSAWRASTAATEVGAGTSYLSPLTMETTVALTHEVDPEGRWLMAIGSMTVGEQGEKLLVDTPRLARVGEWPSTWTPGLDAGDIADELGPTHAPLHVEGSSLTLAVDNDVVSDSDSLGFSLRLLTAAGEMKRVFLGPFALGSSVSTVEMPFCAEGCDLQELLIGGPATTSADMSGSLTITSMTVDGSEASDVVDSTSWRPVVSYAADVPSVTSIADGDELTIDIDTEGTSTLAGISSSDVPAVRPVLTGRTAEPSVLATDDDMELLETNNLSGLPVTSVATADSMPVVGPHGILIDYTMYARDQPILAELTEVFVLARDDTPAAVVAALQDRGISDRTELSSVKSVLDRDAYALALNLYLVVAVVAVLLALAGLTVTLAVQLPERRKDSASLRVIGVRRRQILRAVLLEIAAVLGIAGLAGVLAGAVAQYLVVRTVTLGVDSGLRIPRVVPTLDAARLGLLACVVVAALVVVAASVASLAVRNARASTLRETGR